MSRLSIDEAEIISSQMANYEKTKWLKFELDESKSTGKSKVYKPVRVRFLYDRGQTFEAFIVHNLLEEKNDYSQKRYINCLDEPDVHECPLCQAGFKKKMLYYLPVYNVDTHEVMLWERGKGNQGDLKAISDKHKEKNWAIVGSIYEIRRVGSGLDTEYKFDRDEHDETTIADLIDEKGEPVKVPEVFGTLIIDGTAKDMKTFLETGEYPKKKKEDKDQEEVKPRGTSTTDVTSNQVAEGELIDGEEEIPF